MKGVRIEGYRFGEIVIDGKKYTSDVMIFPERVTSWWRKKGHAVEIEDLTAAVDTGPEIVIIGTGAYGAVRVSPEVEKFLSSRGVRLIVAPTGEACDQYNRLRAKHRLVAAVHLTC
ncbi:MAG: Mth938-like domain-containing protein [Bacillota bacterium]